MRKLTNPFFTDDLDDEIPEADDAAEIYFEAGNIIEYEGNYSFSASVITPGWTGSS